MKFTVHKSVFLNKLTPAMGTVSNKNTITSLEGILLETAEDGLIRISSYDMNKGFRSTFQPISIEREGKFIINAGRLYQTMKVMPEDEIVFDINDNLTCNIYSGKSSFSMFAMKGEDFPNLPDLTSEKGFIVSAEILRKMISKVSHSIADQDNRPMLCGAFFKIKKDGIEVVSSDSFTLSLCNYEGEIEYTGNNLSLDASKISQIRILITTPSAATSFKLYFDVGAGYSGHSYTVTTFEKGKDHEFVINTSDSIVMGDNPYVIY